MALPTSHSSYLLLIEGLRTDIGGTGQAELEILLEEEVIGGSALVLDIVLEVPSSLHPREA